MTDAADLLERDIDDRLIAARVIEARRVRARAPEPPSEVVVRVAPPPSDSETEAMIGALMSEAFIEARRCFQLARQSGTVEMQGIYANRATRLSQAFATLSESLSRHRGKGQQRIVVQHLHSGSQAVGMINEGEPR